MPLRRAGPSRPMRSRRSRSRPAEAIAPMIRVVIFLVAIGGLAFGAAWLADRPGDVAIVWQGMRVETSVAVLAMAIAVVAALAVLAWSILRTLVRAPSALQQHLRMRRARRGYLALSQGLIAVGSGD